MTEPRTPTPEEVREVVRRIVDATLDARPASNEGSADDGRTTVAIGADHGGWGMKGRIGAWLSENGYAVRDCGTDGPDAVDDSMIEGHGEGQHQARHEFGAVPHRRHSAARDAQDGNLRRVDERRERGRQRTRPRTPRWPGRAALLSQVSVIRLAAPARTCRGRAAPC